MTFRHWSRVTPYTSSCELAECCVFAKQSPGPFHCGSQQQANCFPHRRERPFSRSYGAILPSSLTWFLSRTLVYSTHPPVSVCGTVRVPLASRGFSWRHGASGFAGHCWLAPHHVSGLCGAFDNRDPARLDFHFQSEARSAFRVTPLTGHAGSGIFA